MEASPPVDATTRAAPDAAASRATVPVGLVAAGHDERVGGGEDRGEGALVQVAGEADGAVQLALAGLFDEGGPVVAVAGDDGAGAGVPVADRGQGLEEVLDALLGDEPAGVDDQRAFAGEAEPGRRGPARAVAVHMSGSMPLGTTSTRSAGDVEEVLDLPAQVFGRHDHAAGLGAEPPLDGVHGAAGLTGQVALVPARLGGLHRGDERQAERLLEGDRGVGDEPVVGVDDVVALGGDACAIAASASRWLTAMVWPRAPPDGRGTGGAAARTIRTPSITQDAGRPAEWRVTTVTAWPAATRAADKGGDAPAGCIIGRRLWNSQAIINTRIADTSRRRLSP